MVFFYIDDIVLLSHPKHRKECESFRAELLKTLKMRELGELKWFLGIRVLRDRTTRKIWLCQDSYITKICTQFRRSEHPSKAPKTPMGSLTLAPYEGTALKDEIMQYSRIAVEYVREPTIREYYMISSLRAVPS